MPITRTAHVARTAHDRTHVNRLVLPVFGVVELRVRKSEDNGSKSHLPGGVTASRAPSGKGNDNFAFAPGPQLDPGTWAIDPGKRDEVEIWYHLFNPQVAIGKCTIELFRRFQEAPIWKRDLVDAELEDGEHTLKFGDKTKWDGKIGAHADFPGEFLTVERSPYKLKLTVEGQGIGHATVVWTYFHVLIAKVELEYGPKDVLPAPAAGKGDHRKVYDAIIAQGATPPAAGATVKATLESNLFKKGHRMFDNSLYTEYESLWGTGALIPLFAKVSTRDSGGKPVLAPKALGRLRFLWDWESTLTPPAAIAPGALFVQQAQRYDVATTHPKGQNCHLDRGGKRGMGGAAVFPAQVGYAPAAALVAGTFPFKVEAVPTQRKWAAYSYAWDDGKLASKTGVLFQPSRMAGDGYKVSLYVAHDVTKSGAVVLDVQDDPPLKVQPVLMTTTGEFQVWREIHLVRYYKKTATVLDLNIATVQSLYAFAFVDLKNVAGIATPMTAAVWNANFSAAAASLVGTDLYLVDPAINQHAAGPTGCYFRDLPSWIAAIAAGAGVPPAAAAALVAGMGIVTPAHYATHCEGPGSQILESIFNNHVHANDGCNIYHVDGVHNRLAPGASTLRGYALDLAAGSDRRCGYLQLGAPTSYSGPPNDLREFTGAHEFGHHFFLPHTPAAGEMVDYQAHDQVVLDCLMSYNFTVPRRLCGFCQLRLRGWSKAALKPNGLLNSKP